MIITETAKEIMDRLERKAKEAEEKRKRGQVAEEERLLELRIRDKFKHGL